MIFPKIGELSVLRATSWYPYRDLDGRLVAMVARRNRTGGGKDIYPLTWRIRPADQMGYWTVTGWPSGARKPVYGVERMSGAKPPLSLLVVEGEKTAGCRGRTALAGGLDLSVAHGWRESGGRTLTGHFWAKHYASVSDKTVIVCGRTLINPTARTRITARQLHGVILCWMVSRPALAARRTWPNIA